MSKAEEIHYKAVIAADNQEPPKDYAISAHADHFNGFVEGYAEGYHQAEKDLIDKAIGWIKEINNHHHIMRYSDSCEPPLSELTEWFKNYMKEQNINSK